MSQSSTTSKTIITVLIVIGVVGVILGLKSCQKPKFNQTPDELAEQRFKGNRESIFKIVEYIDFQCPACAQGSRVLKEFLNQYPESISLQVKYFPLRGHKHGMFSAKYVECSARQGQFWGMHDILLFRQDQWRHLNDVSEAFKLYAKELTLNQDLMDKCLESTDVEQFITDSKAEGRTLGVRQTPTYFMNGNIIVGKENLIEALKQILEAQKQDENP